MRGSCSRGSRRPSGPRHERRGSHGREKSGDAHGRRLGHFAADHGRAAVARPVRAPDRHRDGREPRVREFRARHRTVRVGRGAAAVRRRGGSLRRLSGADLGRGPLGRGRRAGDAELVGCRVRTDLGDYAVRGYRGRELRDTHWCDDRIAAAGKALARRRHHQRGRIARAALVRASRSAGDQRLGLAHGHARDIDRRTAHGSDRVAVPRPLDRSRRGAYGRGERAAHKHRLACASNCESRCATRATCT